MNFDVSIPFLPPSTANLPKMPEPLIPLPPIPIPLPIAPTGTPIFLTLFALDIALAEYTPNLPSKAPPSLAPPA